MPAYRVSRNESFQDSYSPIGRRISAADIDAGENERFWLDKGFDCALFAHDWSESTCVIDREKTVHDQCKESLELISKWF